MKIAFAAVFFVLTVCVATRIFGQFSGGEFGAVLGMIAAIPADVALPLAALTAVFYAMDWIRFRSLLSLLGFRLSAARGVALTCVSYFVTCLTPTAELHTPAMVFMLKRFGVPVPEALAASVTKSIYMVMWITAFACTSLWLDATVPLPETLRQGLPALLLPLGGIVAALAAVAFFPRRSAAWLHARGARLREGSIPRKIIDGIGRSADSLSRIGRSGDLQHGLCHAASIVFLFAYITIGYVAAHHFGIPISFGRAITVFSVSLLVAYVSPVPGSIGVTELTASYMLDPALTANGMAASLTVRILCWYLVTLPGGIVLATQFRRPDRR